MSDFKKGDTVRLKSGGPLMTVVNTGDYGPTGPEDGVACAWFDGKTPMEEVFVGAALETDDGGPSVSRVVRG